MRLAELILGAAAALSALVARPAAAAEASPVATQPLAGGEVLLELTAMGTARQRADLATFTLYVICHGASEAEATRLMADRLDRIRSAARAAGVREDEVHILGSSALVDPSAAMMGLMPDGGRPQGEQAAAAGQQYVARSTVQIRVRDLARVSALQDRLKGLGIADMGGPAYSLSDDRAVRRRARAEAIATLRADAEAYAATLGMRVVRLVRVSERLGTDFFGLMAANGPAPRRIEAAMTGGSTSSEVEVPVFVGADFALAPQ